MRKRSVARRAHPLTHRECLILDRIGRDRTHKDIAGELGVSINTVVNLAPNPHKSPASTARRRRSRAPGRALLLITGVNLGPSSSASKASRST